MTFSVLHDIYDYVVVYNILGKQIDPNTSPL